MKESDFIINKVSEIFNVPIDKIKKTEFRDKQINTYYRYLCICYLEEHSDYTRREMGDSLGMKHSSVSIALQTAYNLLSVRDERFGSLLDKLNLNLDNKILFTAKDKIHKKSKLTNSELKHLKFMLDNQIPNWKLSNHFRTSLSTIKYHAKKFKSE